MADETPSDAAQPASDSQALPVSLATESRPAAVIAPQTDIEADTAPEDESASDGGYETDSVPSVTTSMSSSIRDYDFENSRRYHRFQEGRYQFPNDEPEQEREDMKHSMVVNLCNGKLHFAPLQSPQKILDIGTGTGIWAIDMGDEYPGAEVLGIDLSPIQPSWVPPNVRFIVDDAEADWIYPADTFDFIHIRHMTSSIRDWPKLVSQAYRALKPGGWIELQELRFVLGCDDDTLARESKVAEFLENVKKALEKFNVDLLGMEKNQQNVRDAGFVHVEEHVFKVPLGTWPKDPKLKTVGLYNRSVIYDGLHGVAMRPFTHGLGWSTEEIEVFLTGVRKGLMDSRQHVYIPFHVVMGQKPV